MKVKIILTTLFVALFVMLCTAQVAINEDGTSADGSSMLDIKSNSRGVLIPRMSTAQRDAISSPVIGLVIFNTTTDCLEIFNLSGWWNMCSSHTPPTGISAIAGANPVCSGSTLSLTGSATGATRWSWTGPNGFISSLQNPSIPGITAAGAGVYTLTASNAAGAATPVSTAPVTVNLSPGAAGPIFGSHCANPGQNGLAYSISSVPGATSYIWNYSGTGFTIVFGSGTRIIYANYSVSTTPGNLTVTPSNNGCNGATSPDFSISITVPTCGGSYTYNNVTTAGYTWLDRNLGATRVATAKDDYLAYGSLYQWGRQGDGHECINWCSATLGTAQNGSTTTKCPNGNCSNAYFVNRSSPPYDWSTPTSNVLWNGTSKGANDPCPAGYRVPSLTELTALKNSFSPPGFTGAFNSAIKMPAAGFRSAYNSDIFDYPGEWGVYWSSTYYDYENAYSLNFYDNSNNLGGSGRNVGASVRCIAQ